MGVRALVPSRDSFSSEAWGAMRHSLEDSSAVGTLGLAGLAAKV